MLPKFPSFRKIQVSDLKAIEKISKQFEPYSDFDFVNLWCWDLQDQVLVSELNGNLVVIVSDFFTNELVCSFLGNNKVNETIEELLKLNSKPNSFYRNLGLVPEASLTGINLDKYIIEIDLNCSDYVFGINNLITYETHQFYKKRKLVQTFLSNHPGISTRHLDLSDQSVRKEIDKLNLQWQNSKTEDDFTKIAYREHEALNRLYELDLTDIDCIGLYLNDKLIGYNISKALHGNYAIGYFGKFDRSYIGVNEYLMSVVATEFYKKGCLYYNAAEDLGLPGLRISKNSYKPVSILRKYTISTK